MRTYLEPGSVLILKEKNTENSYSVRIIDVLGTGAVCIAYLAEDCSNSGLRYIVKECCPLKGSSRESGPAVIWNDDETRDTYFARFSHSYDMQLSLQNNADTSNDLAHITHGLLEANGTLYMLIDPRAAVSYDELPEERTLQDIFRTAKALAEAVGAQHKSGYLNLDIKPSNIMVVRGRPESVLLLDFDSLVEKQSVSSTPSSYSPEFAAPEQLQHKLKKISEATDIYAIGAVVFSRIFGRAPAAEDRSIFSDWDLDDVPLFAKLSSRTKRLTRELLHKTLAASPKSRFQDTAALSKLFGELIIESDPKRRHLVSTCPDPVNIFVGREKELRLIHDAFSSGNKLVFITGMGGMGKTELAKNYAKRYKADYDVICFGEFKGSVENMFMDDKFIDVRNDNEGMASLKSVLDLLDEHVLLIIDNYSLNNDLNSDLGLDKLLECSCRILITTRYRFKEFYETAEEIDLSDHLLEDNEQLLLFEKEYGELTKEKRTAAQSILSHIKGCTLLIPLIAKLPRRSGLSLEEILAKIDSSGITDISNVRLQHRKGRKRFNDPISDIINEVLDMSNLSDEERYVLGCLSIIKGYSINKVLFNRWIGDLYLDEINNLIDNHWIICSGTGEDSSISVHDVIREVVRSDKKHKVDTEWILNPVFEYVEDIDEFTSRGKKDEHGHNYFQPGAHPTLAYPDNYIESYRLDGPLHHLYGPNLERFTKRSRMIELLLSSLDPEYNASDIITAYVAITGYENYYVYNFTTGSMTLLEAVANEPLFILNASDDDIVSLYVLLTLLVLRELYDVDYDTDRSEANVNELTDKLIRNAELADDFIRLSDADTNKKYHMHFRLYFGLLSAGLTWGTNLFTTKYPQYSAAAADKFENYMNVLTESIVSDYPEWLGSEEKRDGTWFEDKILTILSNDYLKPGTYQKACEEQLQGFINDAKSYAEEDAYYEKKYGKPPTPEYELIRKEANKLVYEASQLGYKFSFFPEREEKLKLQILKDPETLSKAESLLDEAEEKYKQADDLEKSEKTESNRRRVPYETRKRGFWVKASCFLAFCKGDLDKALDLYKEYWSDNDLHGFLDYRNLWGVFKTLDYLELSKEAKEILKINIDLLEEALRVDSDNDSNIDLSDNYRENDRWNILELLKEHAERLGDTQKAAKYKALMDEMTNVGYKPE